MPKGKRKELTVKEKIFTTEYVKNKGNGTQAALKAYDTEDAKVAGQIASENLEKPHIREAIDKALVALNLTPEYTLSGFKSLHEDNKKRNPQASVRALENIATIQDLYPKNKTDIELSDGKLKISWSDE